MLTLMQSMCAKSNSIHFSGWKQFTVAACRSPQIVSFIRRFIQKIACSTHRLSWSKCSRTGAVSQHFFGSIAMNSSGALIFGHTARKHCCHCTYPDCHHVLLKHWRLTQLVPQTTDTCIRSANTCLSNKDDENKLNECISIERLIITWKMQFWTWRVDTAMCRRHWQRISVRNFWRQTYFWQLDVRIVANERYQ